MDRRAFWLINLACFSLAACQKDRIQTYSVPKEIPSAAMAPGTPSSREITWKTPEGWKEQAPSSMRVGSFLIKAADGQQADVSVIPLDGEAGGNLFNINRWRGQISLGPLSEADLPNQIQTITPAGRKMVLVNFVNKDKRLIAAIYKRGARTWFFKMSGPDALVRSAKPSFERFLASVKFHEK
jgi:hypothetical protein